MAASSLQLASFGRAGASGRPSILKITVTATATVYATASGGLPIDLTTVLQQGAPASLDNLNPLDIVDIYPVGLSTNGFLPGNLVLGGATYINKPLASQQGQPAKVLTACPATIRLYGIGASAAAHAGFGEVADGAITDAFTIHLVLATGGENQ